MIIPLLKEEKKPVFLEKAKGEIKKIAEFLGSRHFFAGDKVCILRILKSFIMFHVVNHPYSYQGAIKIVLVSLNALSLLLCWRSKKKALCF